MFVLFSPIVDGLCIVVTLCSCPLNADLYAVHHCRRLLTPAVTDVHRHQRVKRILLPSASLNGGRATRSYRLL